jgi:hypothetical protein
MGTRSLTRVNAGKTKILNLYRQMDGYPSGHGRELFEFLDGLVIVNGLFAGQPEKIANGAGCLAAQLVAHFKDGPGSFYMEPVSATDCGQDYEYIVNVTEANWNDDDAPSSIEVKVRSYDRLLFSGTVEEFGKFCTSEG